MKRLFSMIFLFVLISVAGFSQGAVEKEEPKAWSGNFEASLMYNYIYHGPNLYLHNHGVGIVGLKMTDPSGAFSANTCIVYGHNYTRYNAEMSYNGKFYTLTVFPFTWENMKVRDFGIILGAAIHKSFNSEGLNTELKVGILGSLVKEASELNGTYYYVAGCIKDMIFGLDIDAEIGYNSHFFAPEAKDFCANAKISNQWQLFNGLSVSAYGQCYFTDDKHINLYNEFSAGICLSMKVF